MFLCLSVCVTEEHFQESYCLRDWEGGVFLLAAFGRVSLRVLGQGVVAQKVEGYSAFKMCLVTTSPGSPQPYLIHPLLPSSSGALIQCPWRAEILCLLSPTCQEPEQCLALCKHIVVLAELNNSERNISASKQT